MSYYFHTAYDCRECPRILDEAKNKINSILKEIEALRWNILKYFYITRIVLLYYIYIVFILIKILIYQKYLTFFQILPAKSALLFYTIKKIERIIKNWPF